MPKSASWSSPEFRILLLPVLLLPVWFLLYGSLTRVADWLVFDLLNLTDSHFSKALWFFLYECPKVLLLLTLIIFGMGMVRSFFSPERTRKILQGKRTFLGNVSAALLGIVTPFCSCSAIPLFLGFVEAGVPLGVTFSFLIAAPMINEIAVVLLVGMFGWKVALVYVATGLFIAIAAGWIIGTLRLEKWLESWVLDFHASPQTSGTERISWSMRVRLGLEAVRDIVGKVWVYVCLGILVGAAAHGYVPASYLAGVMGSSAWYAVPLSVLIGIPLYSNAAGIIPVVSVLIEKGAALGTALAFMMAVIGLSLPELIILRKVLKMPLILVFVAVVGTGILAVGYLFNFLF